MAADHFIVARQDGHWKVSFHGTEQGPFGTKEEAVDAAIAAAQAAHAQGKDVEVLVQDIESNFHTAWASGEEPDSTHLLSTGA